MHSRIPVGPFTNIGEEVPDREPSGLVSCEGLCCANTSSGVTDRHRALYWRRRPQFIMDDPEETQDETSTTDEWEEFRGEVQKNIRALRTQVKAASEDGTALQRVDTQLARETDQVLKAWDAAAILAYVKVRCLFVASVYAYGVEINPRAVATIQRLPQRTIESIRPMPGITSPRAAIRIPSGPSSTAVPPRTSRTAHPPIVVGLVSGTDRSAGSSEPVTDMSASKTEEAGLEASADCTPPDALARGFGARLALTVEG